jgi:hypothetical protein
MLVALAFTGCAGGRGTTTATPSHTLARTVVGEAANAKAGAVVLTDVYGEVYVKGLAAWPDDVVGKTVELSGLLRREKLIPDPVTNEDGAVTAGAYGDQTVIADADWKVID